jgi:cytochrome c55X
MLRCTRTVLAVVLMTASAIAAAGGATPEGRTVAVAFAAVPEPDAARQRELLRLLKQDCGSCHGMRLTGGLGPALTPGALRTKPAASLVATIVSGRPGTAMPPWRRFISEAEAEWLVARLLTGATDGSP